MSSTHSAPLKEQRSLADLKPPVRGLILDVDGVLVQDVQPIGDLGQMFEKIARLHLSVAIATNNAIRAVDDYISRFRRFGVALEPWQVVTSADATADIVAMDLPKGAAIFAIGEAGLVGALKRRGLSVETDSAAEREYAAVAVGLDRAFDYEKLSRAAKAVRAGARFYGTNPDVTFPTPQGLVPGAGAVLAAISAASGQQPRVIGKPSRLLFETAARRLQLTAADVLVVGDRLETDIAGGQAFGARTALVLTGVSSAEQAGSWTPPPTIVAGSLTALLGL